MYSITINAKTPGELQKAAHDLVAAMGQTTPASVTLADFGLQAIAEYLKTQGFGMSDLHPPFEDTAPAVTEAEQEEIEEKPKAPKKGKAKAAETAETSEPSKTPEELKDIAVKHIMAVYNDPKGKAAAQALLKDFGVKNFHLIPADRWIELHEKTLKALGDIGLL